MAFFQLKSIPSSVWPPIPGFDLAQLWSAYLTLCRTQWLSRAEIQAGQLAQARELLAHAGQYVPYYQNLFREAGIDPSRIRSMDEFRRVPILTRQEYQARADTFVASVLPAGTQKAGTAGSSGTSGISVNVHLTNVTQGWWLAFYLRDLEWCGIDPRGRLAVIRTLAHDPKVDLAAVMRGVSLPYWNVQLHPLIHTGESFGMDLHQEPIRQWEWLRALQPDYLLSGATTLNVLTHLSRDRGERLPNLKIIQAYSETLEKEDRTLMAETFGVPVKDMYSCAEAGYLASACPAGHGLHVHEEGVLFEVLHPDGTPCRPGETGRVVLTTLQNFLNPLIRYEILDDVTLGAERCSCGRGLLLLSEIHGKRRPLFSLLNGRNKTSQGIVIGLRKLDVCQQYQVIQTALDAITIRVVPNGRWSNDSEARIRGLAEEFFESPMQIDLQIMESIPLPPRGKLLVAVNELRAKG